MFNLASVFTAFGAFFGGMFGGHHASTTPAMMHPPANRAQWEASTTAMGGMMNLRNGVFGAVTAIDGTDITVDGRQGTTTASTTYSVDASNAKIIKGPATSTASISDISVGDHVLVEGTVTGDSIAATTIIDGRFMMGAPAGMRGPRGASTTPGMWNNGATSTPGMRHPTPHAPVNPGGPMQGMPGMQGQGGPGGGNGGAGPNGGY